MVRSSGYGKKRMLEEDEESWMNVGITFPPVPRANAKECLDPWTQSRLRPSHTKLVGFSGEVSRSLGKIELEVIVGEGTRSRRTTMEFEIVRATSPYNVLLGRPGMSILKAVPLTVHAMFKFPTPGGVVTIITRPSMIIECQRAENMCALDATTKTNEGVLLRKLLRENMDVFAWKPSDMIRIPRHIAEHSLHDKPSKESVRQKQRILAPERRQVMTKEVEEWVKAGIVHQVRMCIDFKDINKACPKDHYPLPEIDWKIVSVMGFKYKCFLDAYKGYHKVQMSKEDEEKTAFYTDQGTYCYAKMPFGLKNARATYQRLVDKVFKGQIRRNLEAYVYDMVIKIRDEKGLFIDIEKTFKTLRKINMKLNPKKCSFGMEEGKFLGYIVTSEGIRANHGKTKAIMDMQSPKSLKQMQTFSEKLAALNRFLSKGAEHSLPFFDMLKGCTKDNFKWTEEAEQAFLEMKKHIAKLPLLIAPKPASLISPTRVSKVEEAMELNTFEIEYKPRNSVKGQVLADFLTKMPIGSVQQGNSNMQKEPPSTTAIANTDMEISTEDDYWENDEDVWTLFTDGSSGEEGAGAGWVLTSPYEVEYVYALRLNFPSSNNESEYEAVLACMRIAGKIGVQKLRVYVDSNLVAKQINGEFEAMGESMIHKLAAITFSELTKQVLVKVLNERSTKLKEINTVVEEEGDTWMTLIIKCLKKDEWPEDPNERRKLRLKLPQYVMEDGVLFKKSYLVPMLRCVGPRSVVAKAIRQGYDWPTMHADARQEIQKFGPLLEAPGRVKFNLVAIDYFTKWIEAKPLAKISRKDFVNDPFKGWCEGLHIKQMNTAVAHPQANGLVERANKSLMEGVKTRLGKAGSGWVDELPNVIWAHRTMLKQSNGETPFSLTYGNEAVIPVEIGMPTHRTMMINEALNNDELRLNLDLLPERKEMAAIKEAKYKKKMEQQYNKRVRPVSFLLGKYVYQRNEASRAENQGKLGPT
ncbi:reverse transcriptase domain-containing protein [Tanacetum coccineum]